MCHSKASEGKNWLTLDYQFCLANFPNKRTKGENHCDAIMQNNDEIGNKLPAARN